ncbi:MAG: hypothetical protein ACK5JR_05135 [Tropicimonas sp.]|uniref:hypothetical protein n=1 Tax=Tropicimonas sp. TaxID=2067044 RepID=UPI003A8B245A
MALSLWPDPENDNKPPEMESPDDDGLLAIAGNIFCQSRLQWHMKCRTISIGAKMPKI